MTKKHILLVVSGGIAAYKACGLASRLSKTGHEIQVVMTKHACEFVTPLTFAALTHHPVLTDLFERHPEDPIAHVNLAKWADLIAVVPATANLLAKAANGLADDLASAVLLAAAGKPILAAPAMNVHMLENPATQKNLETLASYGWTILEPETGLLACQDTGKGKLPSEETIAQAILSRLSAGPLAGKTVLVTAGPTREALDPVRFLSNKSTGKQGYAIAQAAKDLGAHVILISGPTALTPPSGVDFIPVESARDMFAAVQQHTSSDWFILSAAVADFRPETYAPHKLKKDQSEPEISLVPNPDILAWLGEHVSDSQLLCGFAMETENLEENARGKLERKNCDLLVANNLFMPGAGFAGDTNQVLLLSKEGTVSLPLMSKYDLGMEILKNLEEIDHASGH